MSPSWSCTSLPIWLLLSSKRKGDIYSSLDQSCPTLSSLRSNGCTHDQSTGLRNQRTGFDRQGQGNGSDPGASVGIALGGQNQCAGFGIGPKETPSEIHASLGKDLGRYGHVKDAVCEDGTPASTHVRVLKRFEREGKPYSLLEVCPLTGRKHQIRLTCSP